MGKILLDNLFEIKSTIVVDSWKRWASIPSNVE